MTAGIQPTLASINQQAGQFALDYRKANRNVLDFNDYLTAIGGAAFLTGTPPAGLGMATADANTIISTYGNLIVVATAYTGAGLITAEFNYEENSVPLFGGTWS